MGHVAIVDPDREERACLAAALRAAGHAVVECSRSRAALEAFVARPPDAVVIAADLPDGSGLDLAARLRSTHRVDLPIVLVSADPAVERVARVVGASHTLLRPVDPVDLLTALDEACDAPPLAPDLPRDDEGLVFARYHLRRVLGQGSYGAVYEARDARRGTAVALKVLSPSVDDPDDLQRFVREARVLARVHEPHVVAMLDAGLYGGRAFCVMRLIDGPTLDARLRHAGPLREREAMALLAGLLRALRAVGEQQLVHRDVTPRNVILEGASAARPVLIDFGLAKRVHDQALTAPDVILGTPGFIAPEVVLGAQADARSDLFSLGVLVVQALAGRHPLDGVRGMALLHAMAEAPVPVPLALSPGLRALLARLTALEPAARPATPAEALADLERVALDALTDAPPIALPAVSDAEPTRKATTVRRARGPAGPPAPR